MPEWWHRCNDTTFPKVLQAGSSSNIAMLHKTRRVAADAAEKTQTQKALGKAEQNRPHACISDH